MEDILTALVAFQFFVPIIAIVILDLVTLNPHRYDLLLDLEPGARFASNDPEFAQIEAANDPVVHEAA